MGQSATTTHPHPHPNLPLEGEGVLQYKTVDLLADFSVMAMDRNPRIDDATGKIIGWEQDPYDPGYQASFMRNKADDPQYDASFPDHPLSKVRRYLAQLPGCVEIAPDLKSLPAFGFKPRGSGKKPWWKF